MASVGADTVPKVLKIVSTRLAHRDLISLLLVSPWLHATLISHPSLWLLIDFREMNDAGNRLIAAMSLPRYRHVKQINLEFAQRIEDRHLQVVRNKNLSDKSLQLVAQTYPELLNLTRCVKLTDFGLQQILNSCSTLQSRNL